MSILTLDLGTKMGWVVGSRPMHVSGTWDLKVSRFSSSGMRFVHQLQRLNEVHAGYEIKMVYFEEVRRHRGTDAAHAYGGYLATLMAWCLEHGVPYEGIPVGEIKKHWTGKGNADKDAMVAEAVKRGYAPADDNEADALALFDLVVDRVVPAAVKVGLAA